MIDLWISIHKIIQSIIGQKICDTLQLYSLSSIRLLQKSLVDDIEKLTIYNFNIQLMITLIIDVLFLKTFQI